MKRFNEFTDVQIFPKPGAFLVYDENGMEWKYIDKGEKLRQERKLKLKKLYDKI